MQNIQNATQSYLLDFGPSTYNLKILGITEHRPFFGGQQESILGAYDGVSSQVNPSTGSRAATGRFAAAPTFRHE